jgi:hypothetical protein
VNEAMNAAVSPRLVASIMRWIGAATSVMT